MSEVGSIFARDPNKCTRDDIVALIQFYRERRAQFQIGNMKAGSIAKAPTGKVAELMKSVKSDDLDI